MGGQIIAFDQPYHMVKGTTNGKTTYAIDFLQFNGPILTNLKDVLTLPSQYSSNIQFIEKVEKGNIIFSLLPYNTNGIIAAYAHINYRNLLTYQKRILQTKTGKKTNIIPNGKFSEIQPVEIMVYGFHKNKNAFEEMRILVDKTKGLLVKDRSNCSQAFFVRNHSNMEYDYQDFHNFQLKTDVVMLDNTSIFAYVIQKSEQIKVVPFEQGYEIYETKSYGDIKNTDNGFVEFKLQDRPAKTPILKIVNLDKSAQRETLLNGVRIHIKDKDQIVERKSLKSYLTDK